MISSSSSFNGAPITNIFTLSFSSAYFRAALAISSNNVEPEANSTDFLFGSYLGSFDNMFSLFPLIISLFIGEYCFCTTYFVWLTVWVNKGDSGNSNVGLSFIETFVSVGVATTPTAGTRANLAERHPITTPPPMIPTTPSAFSFLINLEPEIVALSALNPALNKVNFEDACPPAAGIGDFNHLMLRFLKKK